MYQVPLDPGQSAKLAFIARLLGRSETEVLKENASRVIDELFNNFLVHPPASPSRGPRRSGRRGTPVLYTGMDPRLVNGKVYNSYAEVLRIVRPDLEVLLWDPKKHKGDKAENILKRNEPNIYSGLTRA